jgi:hypothetical protein
MIENQQVKARFLNSLPEIDLLNIIFRNGNFAPSAGRPETIRGLQKKPLDLQEKSSG